jgi:hypothetical protein
LLPASRLSPRYGSSIMKPTGTQGYRVAGVKKRQLPATLVKER